MRKAAHPSGGMGSSNPCRWRGERLHHGGGVCLLFVLFVLSRLVVVTRRMQTSTRGVAKERQQRNKNQNGVFLFLLRGEGALLSAKER